jgi:chaperone required for assembly of F1-ATPase
MKKFYTLVSHKKTDEGHAIQLDGKTIKTPSGQELLAPTAAMAGSIVREWGAQGDDVKPDTMPLTQILNTAIDKMRERDAITRALLKYLDTDLLCYRTKEPQALAARQKEIWDPWLAWFDDHFESPLYTTLDIKAIKQDEDTHKQIWNYMEALDEYYFAILNIVTSLSGSIVLALAFLEHEVTPAQIFQAMYVEENYHSELAREDIHGKDPQVEKKQKAVYDDLVAARLFLELLDSIDD